MLLRPEKKDTVVCLAGARLLLRPEKKDTVICLAGARSLLRPEKKFQSSVWRVRNRYYDRKIKKFQLSIWRVHNRSSPRKAWAGSSSPREASVFVPLSVCESVSLSVRTKRGIE